MTATEIRRVLLEIIEGAGLRKELVDAFHVTSRIPNKHGWSCMGDREKASYTVALGTRGSDDFPKLLTGAEYAKMTRRIDKKTFKGTRDAAILQMATSCGLNCGEISRMRMSDLDMGNSRIFLGGHGLRNDSARYENDCEDCRFIDYVGEFDAYYCRCEEGSEHGSKYSTPIIALVYTHQDGELFEKCCPVGFCENQGPFFHEALKIGLKKRIIPENYIHLQAKAIADDRYSIGGLTAFRKLLENQTDELSEIPTDFAPEVISQQIVEMAKLRINSIHDPFAKRMAQGHFLFLMLESGVLRFAPDEVYAWYKTGVWSSQASDNLLTAEERFTFRVAADQWARLTREEKVAFYDQCRTLIDDFSSHLVGPRSEEHG